MASGQRAANDTRGALHEVGQAGEDLRKNINSFADNLLGGNKTHGSTGIHPDAKRAGDALQQGVNDAGKELDKAMDKGRK